MNTMQNYIYTVANMNMSFSEPDFNKACLAARAAQSNDSQDANVDDENPLLSYYGYYSY